MSYRKHIQAAISDLDHRIALLQSQGVRIGHILPNPTSAGTIQYHWIHCGKKTYVKKAAVREFRADCHRGQRVAELQRKIETLRRL